MQDVDIHGALGTTPLPFSMGNIAGTDLRVLCAGAVFVYILFVIGEYIP